MPSTVIPAAKEEVFKTLSEDEALKGVLVSDDKAPETVDEFIHILHGETKREFRVLAGGMSRPPLNEEFKVFFDVVVYKGTNEAKPAEERAVEIFEAAEDALRLNTTLGDTVLWHFIEEMKIVRGGHTDAKRGCMITATIAAKAQI